MVRAPRAGNPKLPGVPRGSRAREPVTTPVRCGRRGIASGAGGLAGSAVLVRHVRGEDAEDLVVRVHEPLGERLERGAGRAGEDRREPAVAVAAVQLEPGLVEEPRGDARRGARDRLDDDAGDDHGALRAGLLDLHRADLELGLASRRVDGVDGDRLHM